MCSPWLKLMALNWKLGMPSATLCVAVCGASLHSFTNSVWEPEKNRVWKPEIEKTMQILFPSDFFKPTKPDEMFREQATAFEKQGMEFSTVNIDELGAEPKIFPPIKNKMVLYRGWMLESKNYRSLCRTIEKNGGTPFINLDEYLSTHHLPNWYIKIKEFTPETVVLDINSDLQNELKKLNWTQFFIKDYVKSLKTSMGSIITIEQIDTVVQEMKKFRGEIEGGICVRKVENFYPETEKRYFVVHGQPYTKDKSDKISPLVKKCSAKISSKFFSVDVVKTKEATDVPAGGTNREWNVYLRL